MILKLRAYCVVFRAPLIFPSPYRCNSLGKVGKVAECKRRMGALMFAAFGTIVLASMIAG